MEIDRTSSGIWLSWQSRHELLRRHLERVAPQRRALPPGGEVSRNFEMFAETRTISFSSLFVDKGTLMVSEGSAAFNCSRSANRNPVLALERFDALGSGLEARFLDNF
jgi:predicted dithiol-disulfide oxidoreductase (DUF899 family)